MAEEVLLVDPLCSGDRPSVLAAGMTLAHALRKGKVAVFMVDALGQVVLMPPESIQVLHNPFVLNADLDALEEDEAIALMVSEGREDSAIMAYLAGRNKRGISNGG
jgi:hypothetical protein